MEPTAPPRKPPSLSSTSSNSLDAGVFTFCQKASCECATTASPPEPPKRTAKCCVSSSAKRMKSPRPPAARTLHLLPPLPRRTHLPPQPLQTERPTKMTSTFINNRRSSPPAMAKERAPKNKAQSEIIGQLQRSSYFEPGKGRSTPRSPRRAQTKPPAPSDRP